MKIPAAQGGGHVSFSTSDLLTVNTNYTTPKDGIIVVHHAGGSTTSLVIDGEVTVLQLNTPTSQRDSLYIPQGMVLKYESTNNSDWARFYPLN